MVILGAGASRACPNTDPNLPMPLLRDLPEVLTRFNPQSGFHSLGQYLDRLLAATSGDVEVLLTFLYRLNESFFGPWGQYGLDAHWIDRIFASSALPEVFTDPRDADLAIAVLKALREVAAEGPEAAFITFSPTNFFTLFQGALREYFHASFQPSPCPLHVRLFRNLDQHDCVVSFNYDDIADYSLYSVGKLTRLSFEGLGFEEIFLPPRAVDTPDLSGIPDRQLRESISDRIHGVKFLKVHGSFNWFCRMEETGHHGDDWTYPVGSPPRVRQSSKGGPEVRYCLGNPGGSVNRANWTLAPIIFPFLTKDSIYRGNAVFARHLAAFQYELRAANEIVLVGKNFQNSDHELNGMIRYATYGKTNRPLHIVDTSGDPASGPFHCSLFNARLDRRYTSFEEYADACGTA